MDQSGLGTSCDEGRLQGLECELLLRPSRRRMANDLARVEIEQDRQKEAALAGAALREIADREALGRRRRGASAKTVAAPEAPSVCWRSNGSVAPHGLADASRTRFEPRGACHNASPLHVDRVAPALS